MALQVKVIFHKSSDDATFNNANNANLLMSDKNETVPPIVEGSGGPESISDYAAALTAAGNRTGKLDAPSRTLPPLAHFAQSQRTS
jgi:hypothetical protein